MHPVLAGTRFLGLASILFGAIELVVLPAPASATTLEVRVAASSDDAEEFASGSMYLNSSDLELTQDSDTQTIGMRFAGLTIPKSAVITAAYIQFVAKEAQSEVTSLTFRAQASDNAPAFTSTILNITARSRTSASKAWSPVAWNSGDAGANQRTPDLSGVIQEVINRGGWTSGNAIAIIVNGTGHRTAYAYDGSATEAALLHVEYSLGTSQDDPPLAVLSVTPAASPPLSVLASGAGSTDTDASPIATYRFTFGDGTAAVTTTAPTLSTTHTYAASGSYTVTLIVTDTAGLPSTAVTRSVTVSSATGTVERRVATSTDDAEETGGSVNLTSSDLELIHDSADQTVGIRWTSIAVPKNAVISAAYIQFKAKESQSEVTTLTIRGQAADNAATFTSSAFSTRARTSAAGTWTPAAWSSGDAGSAQRTPDLSGVIQEIVNRSGWASGNALALIITGTGHRTAYSFDGSASDAALLHIEYGGTPPPDLPPVAVLSVSASGLTATADGGSSTDSDASPIATYRFDFGDGTAAITKTAPTTSAQHTYSSSGTYTVSLRCTDTAGNTSSTVTKSVTVSSGSGSSIAVYAGYYDTHHPEEPKTKPSPWKGSSNTIFAGTSDPDGRWDTSAIRVDNLGSSSISGVGITVDMGSHDFSLWGTYTIPAGQRLIFAQTGVENFDGSDTNEAGCYYCSGSLCNTAISSTVPVVHLTIAGKTTDYVDPGQILNTHGVDAAGCPFDGTRKDESSAWQQIYPRVSMAAGASPASFGGDGSVNGDLRPTLDLGPLWPNPTSGTLHVQFRTAVAGPVRLDVYDIAGRLVHHGTDDLLEAGEHDARIDLDTARPGMYFCLMVTSAGAKRLPFVLTR